MTRTTRSWIQAASPLKSFAISDGVRVDSLLLYIERSQLIKAFVMKFSVEKYKRLQDKSVDWMGYLSVILGKPQTIRSREQACSEPELAEASWESKAQNSSFRHCMVD